MPTNRPEAVRAIVRDAGLSLPDEPEWFMTTDLSGHPRRAAPAPYECTTAVEGPVVEAEVRHPSAGVVARGSMAVIGTDAIADRIETDPSHRRLGLGSVVMGALAEPAMAQGAKAGILIASTEGRGLYATVGWAGNATVLIAKPHVAAVRGS
ncbi:hypothetical protein AB0L13_00395 [Saccharopolyspora shandongensis]|uniref:GNAT family N-acetyltransferase n=1 Tax=Saccharopolyspora shandongensis TaxID=418495 RepID=UPI00342AADCF